MAYLKRWKATASAMGRTRPDGRCRKHPNHNQSPGVCSICLTQKLSQLSGSAFSSSPTTSSSMDSLSSSSFSSSSCSSCSSPTHHFPYGSEGKGSFSFLFSFKNVLTKSRSLVFVSKTSDSDEEKVDNEKMKTGFLSKLPIRPRNKRIKEDLVHSTTMRGSMKLTT